jgi:hypothetical protein
MHQGGPKIARQLNEALQFLRKYYGFRSGIGAARATQLPGVREDDDIYIIGHPDLKKIFRYFFQECEKVLGPQAEDYMNPRWNSFQAALINLANRGRKNSRAQSRPV